jgi:2-amino-4-hydroxy-6-hydroxymethyldihydropteridine diphosphokinase
MTNGIYLLLGSNLGDRRNVLVKARELVDEIVGEVVQSSKIYETEAWGITSQPSFFNQVIEIRSTLSPDELLATLHQIENKLGRVRREKWGERTLDIDILYYGDLILNEEQLVIPHPEIPTRRFTLVPLVEIAAEFLNPSLSKSNNQLLAECNDNLKVTALTPTRPVTK